MTVDIYQPNPGDTLSLTEYALYHLIMDYRADNGLAAIPLSESLTTTAGRHAIDTYENIWLDGLILPEGANLHSWSDAPYFSDHRDPAVMWDAPARLGTPYPGAGFEISAAGYTDVAAALEGWKGSPGHNTVILNEGVWASQTWTAIGIGVELHESGGPYGGKIYHVWFGTAADPAGAPDLLATEGADSVAGTAFADAILGLGGNDSLTGGDGDDALSGDAGRDRAAGGDGDDTLTGGAGNDRLSGEAGNDILSGSAGRDTLTGGAGDDTLIGGPGADTLVFAPGAGDDRVQGFGATDVLHLDPLLWAGTLTAAEVIADFARDTRTGLVLDFGADSITLARFHDAAALEGQIAFL